MRTITAQGLNFRKERTSLLFLQNHSLRLAWWSYRGLKPSSYSKTIRSPDGFRFSMEILQRWQEKLHISKNYRLRTSFPSQMVLRTPGAVWVWHSFSNQFQNRFTLLEYWSFRRNFKPILVRHSHNRTCC